MAHAISTNYPLINNLEVFQSIWRLTRAMLASGWRYKASGDALTKDTTGPQLDRWAVGGGINMVQVGAQTGTNPSIAAASSGSSTISSVSGFVANSVGRFLKVTGAVNVNNNGVFRITSQTGTTVTVFNPGAIAESGTNITWSEQQGGAAASITASGTGGATPGRAIVTGLTGMVNKTTWPSNETRGSVGDHLTIIGAATGANNGTFRIVRFISATSVEIDNGSATTDANNGSLIWVESSPLAQVYPTSLQGATGQGAWLNLQGPSTMKIPIGSNTPTGTFIRGEKVTATTSGATGTLLGVMVDTGGGTGCLVIAPRLNGTGSGIRGWTSGSTDTITGALSGATITSSTAIPIEFIREMVFWKSTQSQGYVYLQTVDQNLESASRFSVIAANAGITATIAPGSSAAGGFPTAGSFVMLGSGGVAAVTTSPLNWYHTSNTLGVLGSLHALCANCIEDSTTDADGSWIAALGAPNGNGTSGNFSYAGMSYQRVDGSEDGDVDPYVTFANSAGTAYAGSRTGPTTPQTNLEDFFSSALNTGIVAASSGNTTSWSGWRRRGFAATDAWQQFAGMCLTTVGAAPINTGGGGGISRVQGASQQQLIKEAIWVVSTNTSQRMRKGYLRWMWLTEGGNTDKMFQSNGAFWIQLGANPSNSNPSPVVCGPWDGFSVGASQ
jgi:hypothetical protein